MRFRFFGKKAGQAKQVEGSLLLRRLILAAMMVPLVALLRTGGIRLLGVVLLGAIGMALGHWYSYRYREQENSRLVRGLIFLGIHVVFGWMCVGLVIGAAYPQAQVAILAQAVTTFDLRYRGSLFNTLFISGATLYIAASISRTAEFALYLILFGLLVLAAFFVAEQKDGRGAAALLPQEREKAVAPSLRVRRALTPLLLRYTLLAGGAIFVIFLFTPRFAGRPFIPPFSISLPISGGVKSEIINPGLPLVQIDGWSDGTSDYFYGFDTNLDLRYRGGLHDEVVMYVRSPSRSYWRSHSYDFYDGTTWRQSNKSLTPLKKTGSVSFKVPYDERGVGDQIVQSFTIVRDQPNLLFAAYRPAEVFIMARKGTVVIDRGEGLRTSEALKEGMTYSVISYRPDFEPERLRQASTDYPTQITRGYLQLPDNISERVRGLASELTAAHDNTFDQVMALNDHLYTSYPYNFFPPPHPSGAEVVDTFLFEDKEGICEQYATSLVVMARTLGIPARLVTGYGPGDYSQLTGYYEVRGQDAHSWVEVYFPDDGWVPFDPTPGWTAQPYPTPVQTWFFSAQSSLELNIPFAAIAEVGMAGMTLIAPYLMSIALLVIFALLSWQLKQQFRKWQAKRSATSYSMLPKDNDRQAIMKRYRQAIKLLSRQAYTKPTTSQTMSEYASQIDSPNLSRLTQMADIAAYRPATPEEQELERAEEAYNKLREEMS